MSNKQSLSDAKVAVIIPSYNEELNIQAAVEAALVNTRYVFVADQNSTDNTQLIATAAGAVVINCPVRGKASALRYAIGGEVFNQFDYVTIVDADTQLDKNFLSATMYEFSTDVNIKCVTAYTRSDYANDWNPFTIFRSVSGWYSQGIVRTLESKINGTTIIAGSNFTAPLDVMRHCMNQEIKTVTEDGAFDAIIRRDLPGAVVKHSNLSKATTQDPRDLRSFFMQQHRWIFGHFQVQYQYNVFKGNTGFAWAHRLKTLDMLVYMISPLLFLYMLGHLGFDGWLIPGTIAGMGLRTLAAAICLKQWRLFIALPLVILLDGLNRLIILHSFIVFLENPYTESAELAWQSPVRVAAHA